MARPVAALGSVGVPHIDEHGMLHLDGASLDWWVGADDRWHIPTEEPTVRRHRLGPAPVYETTLRVPGGEARQRAYGVAGGDGAVVIEIENASPAPFALAFVLRPGPPRAARRLRIHGNQLVVDDRTRLALPRPPLRWATAVGTTTRAVVCSGGAQEGPFPDVSGRDVEAALIYPVAHRTTLRVAFACGDGPGVIDTARLADADTVRRGWDQQLSRGLRTELTDALQHEVDAARADLLLEPPSAGAFVALEAWGFDAEARAMWDRLRMADRRRARRRTVPYSFLMDLHRALLRVRGDTIDVLPGFRPEWLGQPLAVHDAPVRGGTLSFAVRWHGARPAVLWDAPAGVTLRASALDRGWSATTATGETLLAIPPTSLLAMGTAVPEGTAIEDPEVFT